MKRLLLSLLLLAAPVTCWSHVWQDAQADQTVSQVLSDGYGQRVSRTASDATTITVPDLPKTLQSVDYQSIGLRNAFTQLLEQTKTSFVLDDDLPATKITLRLESLQMSTILDVLCETGSVGWRLENRDGKPVVHVGKTITKTARLPLIYDIATRDGGNFFSLRTTTERRATFTCPHCKNQITMIRRGSQPKCPTCQRLFQPDWKFCPFDGAKRPPSPSDWHFCPICGKPISMENAVDDPTNLYGGDPFSDRYYLGGLTTRPVTRSLSAPARAAAKANAAQPSKKAGPADPTAKP